MPCYQSPQYGDPRDSVDWIENHPKEGVMTNGMLEALVCFFIRKYGFPVSIIGSGVSLVRLESWWESHKKQDSLREKYKRKKKK